MSLSCYTGICKICNLALKKDLTFAAALVKYYKFYKLYREKKAKEEATLAAKVKVAWEQEAEEQVTLELERQREDKQRQLMQKLQDLEMRQAANNLRVSTTSPLPLYVCLFTLCQLF